MNWQMLLGINLAAGVVREFLNKKIVNKVNPIVMMFYVVLFGQIWQLIYYLVNYRSLPRWDLMAMIPGIFFVIGFSSYLAAVKISLSQTILFQSYSILITILLSAIYLGESRYFNLMTTAGLKIAGGIILAFVGLWYLLHVGNKKEERLEKKWFYYIVFVIIFLGVGAFLGVSSLGYIGPLEALLNQGVAMLLLLILIILITRKNLNIGKANLSLILVNSIFGTIAVVAFYSALPYVAVAKFFPIQQVSIVILTIAVGYLFYGEKEIFTGRHFVGMALGMLGILLLVTS